MPQESDYWPYILMMPKNHKERIAFIKDVLASRIAVNVLPKFEESETVLQKDLVAVLPHSNKSILRYLEILRSYELIETGSRIEHGKRVVYHTPTERGLELIDFFSKEIPINLSKITEHLLENYISHLLKLYRSHELDESIIFEIVSKVRAKAMLDGSIRYAEPDIVVVGASAIFTEIHSTSPIDDPLEVGVQSPKRYPGGPTISLAMEMAKKKQKVVFLSSIGDDINGWNVLSSLIPLGIDVSHLVVQEGKKTNETILLRDNKSCRSLVAIDEEFSLSITSPSEVPWDILEVSSMVYIGEVFLEVALPIATLCRSKDILVIYRCSPHYWNLGVSKLRTLLEHIDLLFVSPAEWEAAKQTLGQNPIVSLRKYTSADVLIKIGPDKFGIIRSDSTELEVFSFNDPSSELDAKLAVSFLEDYIISRDCVKALQSCFA